MRDLVIIDGNSVGNAAQNGNAKNGKLYAGEQETTAIYGMLRSTQVIMRARTHQTPVVCWDGRSWRHDFFPDYKGNRTDTAEKVAERERYRSQRKEMALGLHLLGVRQVIASNMEADDLAAMLTRKCVASGRKVALITGDKDYLQLVQPGVVWVDHKSNPERKCNAADFHAFTGYRTPKAFVHAKGLQGDAGDNVKPNLGIGAKGAQSLLAVFEDVYDFIATPLDEAMDRYFLHHGKNMTKKMQELHENAEALERFEWALKLMDLNHPDIPKPVGYKVTHAEFDRAKFEAFCGRHAFMSILKNMDQFIAPFVTLNKGDNA